MAETQGYALKHDEDFIMLPKVDFCFKELMTDECEDRKAPHRGGLADRQKVYPRYGGQGNGETRHGEFQAEFAEIPPLPYP